MVRPRVLLMTRIHPCDGYGGEETFSRSLSRAFPGLELLTSRDIGPSAGRGILRELRLAHALASVAVSRHEADPYDLIIANGSMAMALPKTLPRRPAPVVTALHGNYAGYCRKAMNPMHWKSYYTRWVATRWERTSAQRADQVVAESPSVARDIRKYYGCRVKTIPNGVKIPSDQPSVGRARKILGVSSDRKLIAFVGRPTREKGYDRLLGLADSRPDLGFLIATSVPPARLPRNAWKFVEPGKRTLACVYAAADLLLFPSRFEGCAYIPLEAMAHGTPVITTDTGSFTGLSGRFEGGWIVVDPDQEALKFALTRVLDSLETFAPRSYVERNFSLDIFVDKYRRLATGLVPNASPEVEVA